MTDTPKKKYTPAEIAAIIDAAFAAAEQATADYISKNSEHYPCGFAWVNIKPARGPFVTALKKMGAGKTDDYSGGFHIWNPSKNYTQCMDAKEAGSRAFAAELQKHGVNARSRTRID